MVRRAHRIPPFVELTFVSVPLGQRRRFGPAPTEEAAPPQLAQPSPSAYPRPQHQDNSPGKRGRDESPTSGDPKGKLPSICSHSAARVLAVEVFAAAFDALKLWQAIRLA